MVDVNLGAVITAMVTPFTQDHEVDYRRAAQLAMRLVDNGSDGVLVAGTTGESPALEHGEKLKLFETVLEAVGDRATVIAGTGTNSTGASVKLTKQAEAIGVRAVMLVCPYYNKPTQEGLYQHFATIAAATELPVMIYNIPGRTGVNMLPATSARLARLPNVMAFKEAAGSLDQASEMCRLVPDGVRIYSGDDSLTLPMMSVGGAGVVSVASHVAGNEIKEMCSSFLAGDVERARRLHFKLWPLFKVLFITTNPIPVKAALRLSGFDCGPYRLPMTPPTPEQEEAIRQVLAEQGLVG
jgi:4-hydroxy-tetrahydrodipicolinate synthase